MEPYSKSVVTKHFDDKDVLAIWQEIKRYHDSSMATELRIQTVSSYVTSVRLSKLDWRGSNSTWLLNYAEQLRLYNDMVPNQADQFSDGMMIAFLKSAVSGVPGLSSVHATWTAAQKGAGIRNSVLNFLRRCLGSSHPQGVVQLNC